MEALACGSTSFRSRLLYSAMAVLVAVGMCFPPVPSYAEDLDDDSSSEQVDEDATAEAQDFDYASDASEVAGDDDVDGDEAITSEDPSTDGDMFDDAHGAFREDVDQDGDSDIPYDDQGLLDDQTGASGTEATDLSDSWHQGAALIDEPGNYVLTDDVQATAPLTVALAEGESATVDLAGHDVHVGVGPDASGADWHAAIDLSMNRGSIAFVDSSSTDAAAFDRPVEGTLRSAIVLSADASVGRCAVVVDAWDQNAPAGDASFTNIRFALELTDDSADPQDVAASWESRVVVWAQGRISQDGGANAEEAADDLKPSMTLDGCMLQMSDLSAQSLPAEGNVALVDAGAARVSLDGSTGVLVEGDALREALLAGGSFLSEGEGAFAIGSGFRVEQEEDFQVDLPVFGFPRGLGDVEDAVVAVAKEGEAIAGEVTGMLAAAAGCELAFDESAEAADGFSRVRIARGAADEFDGHGGSEGEADGSLSFDAVGSEGGFGQGADAVQSPVGDGLSAGGESDAGNGLDALMQAQSSAEQDSVQSPIGQLSSSASSTLQAMSDDLEQTDLGKAWSEQAGGLDGSFTIDRGGTYYLNGDVTAKSNLVIDAADQDVVIKFNGHKLVIDGAGLAVHKTMVSVVAARSVTFDGSCDEGASALESAGEADVWGISSAATDCAVSASDLTVRLSSKTNAQRNLSVHAVRIASGTLALARCTLDLDMGNQSLKNNDLINDRSPEVPSAVYALNGVRGVVLDGCTVRAAGPQGFALDDVSNLTSIGNVYAVYSQAVSTQVKGGNYAAMSLRGSATCLHALSLEVTPDEDGAPVKLEAGAALVASGIMSTTAGSVLIDAPLEFADASGYEGFAQVSTTLRESVQNGFEFGPRFAQGATGSVSALVLQGKDLASANANGMVIGMVSSGMSQAQADEAATRLENALPGGACRPAANGNNVVFGLDSERAVAKLDDGTLFSTIDEALAAFGGGNTLTLLADAGSLAISTASEGVLDLGGHTISSLEFASTAEGAGITVRNGSINGVRQIGGDKVAVYHHGAAPLTLSGVDVNATGVDARICGIYAASKAGALTVCDNSRLFVKASRHSSTATNASGYGVYMASNGPALVLDHAALSVTTASVGVAVYGAYSTVSADVRESAVNVTGAKESACALYVGGNLDASASIFRVHTLDAAQRACGIWARTANPKATDVVVDGCSVMVTSAADDVSESQYACFIGATSPTGAAAPTGSWKLSGQCLLRSAGALHMGLNVGDIEVASDFSLSQLSDSRLVVSQSKRENDVGVTLQAGATLADADRIGTLFSAAAGSYYDGWILKPDFGSGEDAVLVWRPEGSAAEGGAVAVESGSTTKVYATLSDALRAARSGDVLKLLVDLVEPNSLAIVHDDLTVDLNGHKLTLRAGSSAKVSKTSSGGALSYEGAGTLSIVNGTLAAEVGSVSESASALYQGIAVTGGGTLTVGGDCTVDVRYVGSTISSAAQQSVALRGIALSNGALELEGRLAVTSATAAGTVGALRAYGVFADPAAEDAVSVDVAQGAEVDVDNITAAKTTKNLYYAEALPEAVPQGGSYGLREITIDPEVDPDFYNDVVDQFRHTASFDDPTDTTARNTFSASIYYIDAMALAPENEDAWYYGLKIWAYSDEVKASDVGKKDSIVPTHFFVSSPYDELPDAYGVATSANASGTASVNVAGSVSAKCANGNACTLDAGGAEGSQVAWTCMAGTLEAAGDTVVHPVAGEEFDLRHYIEFSSEQSKKVAYPGATISKVVRFANATGRAIAVGENVDFVLDGKTSFSVQAGDAACVEASSFEVGPSFSLADSASKCSIANPTGANEAGAVFALPASQSQLDAALFEDSYETCTAGVDGDGRGVWEQADGCSVLFKVGDAVVARRSGPGDIRLDGPSAAAERRADQRQGYTLVGWSTNADERAVSGYVGRDGSVSVTEDCTYYAVYETQPVDVPVSFTNVFDDQGRLQEPVKLSGRYGQTVGEVLEAAGASLPKPHDYVDAASGTAYRFAGWHPYSKTATVSPLLYDESKVKELAVTLSANGVSTGALELRAVYEAATPSQRLVTFVVDGFSSTCVVDDGQRPVYTTSNASNSNYVVPSKQATETGKTFTFKGWFVDDDGDGEVDEGEQLYTSILPPATQDVTYTAAWSWKWSDISYTFNTKYYDEAKDVIVNNGVRVIQTTYEKPAQEIADTVAKIGDTFGSGGKIYTMRGWAKRKTDVEPLYDQDHALPSVSSSDRAINDTYSSTYYGVYDVSDHMVDVTFYDGNKNLGNASVAAASTTVNAAFAALGTSKPADKSSGQVFLGWATSVDATTNVEGTSTSIETLAPGAQEALSLYAVYGAPPVYSVRLRTADGKQMLYTVLVQRGSTVNEVLAQVGRSITAASQAGKYFAGWRTAAGAYFSLDAPVNGSADYFASYADVVVDSEDTDDINANVTVSYEASSAVQSKTSLESIEFSLVPRDAPDTPLRTTTAKNGYTILKSYDMRLRAIGGSDADEQITGEFGTAKIKVYVGAGYRNSKVRAFWLGMKDGQETVMNSSVKDVDGDGYIEVSIGNFTIGDEDEGGNLAIAYIAGEAGSGTLSGIDDDDTDETDSSVGSGASDGSSSLPASSGGSGFSSPDSPDDGVVLGISDSGSSLGSSSLTGSTSLSGTSSQTGSTGLVGSSSLGASSGLSTGVSGSSLLSGSTGSSSLLGTSGSSSLSSGPSSSTLNSGASASKLSNSVMPSSSNADAGESESTLEGTGEEPASDWDSNAVVFLLIALALGALLGRKLWLLFAGKRRRDDDEDEDDESFDTRPQEGIRF